jgi:predicted RNA binding protein YcfA (HicA-like mRNA interferase family)
MTRADKLAREILFARADANVDFADLRKLLLSLGFVERVRGSHHIFAKDGVDELLNLQREGKHAKPYQLRQVRMIVVRYRLWSPGNE